MKVQQLYSNWSNLKGFSSHAPGITSLHCGMPFFPSVHSSWSSHLISSHVGQALLMYSSLKQVISCQQWSVRCNNHTCDICSILLAFIEEEWNHLFFFFLYWFPQRNNYPVSFWQIMERRHQDPGSATQSFTEHTPSSSLMFPILSILDLGFGKFIDSKSFCLYNRSIYV